MKNKIVVTALLLSLVGQTAHAGRGGAIAGGVLAGAFTASAISAAANRSASREAYYNDQYNQDAAYNAGFQDGRTQNTQGRTNQYQPTSRSAQTGGVNK